MSLSTRAVDVDGIVALYSERLGSRSTAPHRALMQVGHRPVMNERELERVEQPPLRNRSLTMLVRHETMSDRHIARGQPAPNRRGAGRPVGTPTRRAILAAC